MMGYTLEELVGNRHRLLVAPAEHDGDDYRQFWKTLAAGDFVAAEFKRIRKNGDVVWIQGSYNPVFDKNGHLYKIIKFASDVSAAKLKSADDAGQIAAIDLTQAIITSIWMGRSCPPTGCCAKRCATNRTRSSINITGCWSIPIRRHRTAIAHSGMR